MSRPLPRRPLAALVLALLAARASAAPRTGAVATEHAFGAAAGAEMLRVGGTVVDAAIAAATTVCVVHACSCGIGGGGFALVHLADAQDAALDFRERAPAGMPLTPDPPRLRSGGLAVGVPGEVAGLEALHRRFGRLPLARVLAPAIRLARDGFALADSPFLRREIERNAALLAADPALRAVFLGPDGALPGPDFHVVNPDLAATLEAVAAGGPRAFYEGRVAGAIAAAVHARGGVLSEADLRAYRPVWRRPLHGVFRGRRIVTFPPPGSGGVVLTALGILAHDDLAALGAGTPTTLHLLSQALAQAFADRARWYGDPAFTTVPLPALLAPPRLAALRAAISALGVRTPTADLAPDHGTANVSVVDAEGNAAVITTTINTGFGAGILVPGTGVVLNDEMDDFAAAPDVPNAFGLTGGDANAVRPGKRPQSSMSPTVVLAGRRPELVVGGSGGPTIISGVVQAVLGVTAFGFGPRAAVEAPRIHDQAIPPVLTVEQTVPPAVQAVLVRLGHRVVVQPTLGAVSAAGLGRDGVPVAAGDPRKDGGAAAVP